LEKDIEPRVEIAVRTLEISVAPHPGTARFKGTGREIFADRRLARKPRLDSDRVAAEHRPETVKVNEFRGKNREKP
jgi:hypothetical protein